MSEKTIYEIEGSAFYKLSYGVFALFTNDGKSDNACIINTVTQITDKPKTISITVNKANYSNEIIKNTGRFCISVLDERTPFEIFKQFGFSSGRDNDKLKGVSGIDTAECGLKYLREFSNAYICAEVISSVEVGTHTVFIAEVVEAKVLSKEGSMTYAYYFENVKPKPQSSEGGKSQKIVGWRCKICNYEYKGAELPSDFVCPWCKHPAEDFEPIYE